MNKLFPSIRRRLQAATPGPWRWTIDYHYDQTLQHLRSGKEVFLETNNGVSKPNRDFIANAPTDLANLLSCLDEAVEALQNECYCGPTKEGGNCDPCTALSRLSAESGDE